MRSPRAVLFASLAATGIATTANAESLGQNVAQKGYQAEMTCQETIQHVSVKTGDCLEALEEAIQALAEYQHDVSLNPENYGYSSVEFGEDRNSVSVRPDRLARTEGGQRMGHDALITETHRDIAENLDLNLSEGIETAIVNADIALKKVFIYARADSYGVHPEGNNIGKIVTGLAGALNNERQVDADFDIIHP